MAKSREAFRTISEVAEWLDTPAHVLRFWESRFSQVKPVKRAGGRRYYRPNDMLLLGGIRRLLHDDGITIKGVQKILREKGVRHVVALSLEELDEANAPETDAPKGEILKAPVPNQAETPPLQPSIMTESPESAQAPLTAESPPVASDKRPASNVTPLLKQSSSSTPLTADLRRASGSGLAPASADKAALLLARLQKLRNRIHHELEQN